MMRTALGWSFPILLALGANVGCSSKDVDEPNGSGGGSAAGSATGGSGNSGGNSNSSGTSNGSGGNSNTSGTGNSSGGNSNGSGGTSTAGTGGTGPACPLVCLDEMTAQFCDTTGAMMTVNCTEVFAEDGVISNGCLSDETGEGCTIDDLADMACADGAAPFTFCAGLTQDDVLDVYVGCFHDMNGAHAVIPCYADFVMGTEDMPTVDCDAADAACLPEEM